MAYERKCSGRALVATVSTAAILAAWMTTANAQGLNLTEAEKTPAKCDTKYKVTDLAGLKAPKAKKPYKIEFSVPDVHPLPSGGDLRRAAGGKGSWCHADHRRRQGVHGSRGADHASGKRPDTQA